MSMLKGVSKIGETCILRERMCLKKSNFFFLCYLSVTVSTTGKHITNSACKIMLRTNKQDSSCIVNFAHVFTRCSYSDSNNLFRVNLRNSTRDILPTSNQLFLEAVISVTRIICMMLPLKRY